MKTASKNPYKDIVFAYNPSCYLSISYIPCHNLCFYLNYESIVYHDIFYNRTVFNIIQFIFIFISIFNIIRYKNFINIYCHIKRMTL